MLRRASEFNGPDDEYVYHPTHPGVVMHMPGTVRWVYKRAKQWWKKEMVASGRRHDIAALSLEASEDSGSVGHPATK